jgi:UDP-arabinose 4-epimerase
MSVIFVTGGAGFIGSHTCKALAAEGFAPVTFDNLSTGHAENVRWGPLVVGDILDRYALDRAFELYHPRAVIHFAGLAYGVPEILPISETAKQSPISPYGRSKLACEQVVKDSAAALGIQFVIFRYFNACGADKDGELSERHSPETHLISLAIDAATGQGPPLEIYGADCPTSDGTCERDFVHVS